MKTNKKTDSSQSKQSALERIEQFHPYKTFLFFALTGSTILFLAMTFLYFISITRGGIPQGFQFPKAFVISTILLLVSSYFISGSVRAFKADNFNRLKFSLGGTFVLGL